MEVLKLTRNEYNQALEKVDNVSQSGAYLDQFSFEFPEGLNTANTMEICKAIQDSSFESKVHITLICIEKKNVNVKCPNGEAFRFCLSDRNDSLEGFELFREEPLALYALSDTVYGYILKKSLRSSQAPMKNA